jgi:class 3 adenylate cyclase/tetratricopeptide (TPR) repeat protein
MRVCRQCGTELPDRARYCPACGARVDVAAAEERKVVSVLFADLVESTAAASGRDPEDVRAAVQPQLARIRSELERYGGTVEKYVGDAVMAVFGAPVAHEDDAERAVRAAIAIRDALGASVKVAVNTGEAVVAVAARPETGESIASGDVLNTTYRIEEATPPGAVLAGDSTYRATWGAIDYGERRLITAKGKDEPIVVWEAVRARGAARAFDERPPLAPLVGRRQELALIIDTLARAKRDRTVQLLTLVGAAGIGKSRLVWELQRALADDPGLVTWRRGRCLPYGDGVTFWALADIVKEQATILETDDAEATAAKLRRAVRDLVADPADAAWVEGHLSPVVGLAGEVPSRERREEAFAAWRRFFEALAEWGPLVLVIEDVHWADEGLLDFLDHLADWASSSPLLLLCTARPELHERRPQWGARRNAATLALAPLTGNEMQMLIRLLLRQSDVPEDLAATVLGHAEGNPLYTEEFVRMLVDRELLQRDGDGWQLRRGEVPLPESVQGIIASRLDALTPGQKALVHEAAVIGRTFWVGALAAMTGRDAREVDVDLRALEQKEFVRRQRSSSVAGEDEYIFRHALVRDVAYNQIPRAQRSAKHRAAADWLESLAGRQDRIELLAHHLWKAAMLAQAAGRPDSSLEARAIDALADAGERALRLNSFEAASNYLAAALELADEHDRRRPELLFRLGSARFRSIASGARDLEQAIESLLDIGDVERAAEAEIMLGEEVWMQGRRDEGLRRVERARELVADAPASRSKAYVLCNVARFLRNDGRDEEAIRVGKTALAMAEQLGVDELCANALCTLGVARSESGDLGGVGDLERGLELARNSNSPEAVRAYLNLGSIVARLGDLPRAFELHAEGRSAAERFGDLVGIRWLQAEQLYEDYWSGRTDAALRRAEEIIREVEAGAPHRMELDARFVRGWIRLDHGDFAGADGDARRALDFARTAGDPQALFPALALAARAALAVGRDPEADETLDELLRCWDEWGLALPSAGLPDVGWVAGELGRASDLEQVAAGKARTRWLDGAIAVARGDLERATAIYREIGSAPHVAAVKGYSAAVPGSGYARYSSSESPASSNS